MMKRPISAWSAGALAWQMPLALLSLVFYKTVRSLLRGLVKVHYRRHPEETCHWRPFSAELLDKPLALTYVMTNAPRLNLHAIAAAVGPLAVTDSLSVDVSAAARSARSWSLVVYEAAGARTVTSINPMSADAGTSWHTLTLRPGSYGIMARFYQWSPTVLCPSVRIDGKDAVPALAVSPSVIDFYHDLSQRSNWLYFCLHYHIYVMLRFRAWLPRAWVERHFLPVGNPDTRFYYGVLERGERLAITLDGALLDSHEVYLTLYDRASFPIQWSQVCSPSTTTPPCSRACMYLIRVHPVTMASTSSHAPGLEVEIV